MKHVVASRPRSAAPEHAAVSGDVRRDALPDRRLGGRVGPGPRGRSGYAGRRSPAPRSGRRRRRRAGRQRPRRADRGDAAAADSHVAPVPGIAAAVDDAAAGDDEVVRPSCGVHHEDLVQDLAQRSGAGVEAPLVQVADQGADGRCPRRPALAGSQVPADALRPGTASVHAAERGNKLHNVPAATPSRGRAAQRSAGGPDGDFPRFVPPRRQHRRPRRSRCASTMNPAAGIVPWHVHIATSRGCRAAQPVSAGSWWDREHRRPASRPVRAPLPGSTPPAFAEPPPRTRRRRRCSSLEYRVAHIRPDAVAVHAQHGPVNAPHSPMTHVPSEGREVEEDVVDRVDGVQVHVLPKTWRPAATTATAVQWSPKRRAGEATAVDRLIGDELLAAVEHERRATGTRAPSARPSSS